MGFRSSSALWRRKANDCLVAQLACSRRASLVEEVAADQAVSASLEAALVKNTDDMRGATDAAGKRHDADSAPRRH